MAPKILRPRKLIMMAALAATAIASLLVLASIPRVVDAPDDIRAQQIDLKGRHFLLIDGTHSDAMSQMVMVRIGAYSNDPEELRIDVLSAPFLWYTKNSI